MDSPPGGWGVPSEIYRYKGKFQEIYRYKDQKPDLSFRGLSAPQARNFCDFEVEAYFSRLRRAILILIIFYS